MAEAGPSNSRDDWHSASIKVPFQSNEHALVAKRALDVDREQNGQFVERKIIVEGEYLTVFVVVPLARPSTSSTDQASTYTASTVRILRLSTNSFLSSLDLVMQTITSFDPALPQPTDEELAEQSRIANSGNTKGIELRGDGKGAGSGEEIKG